MTSSTQPHTILVPWRKVCAVLPVLALIGSPVLFVPPTAPAHGINTAAVSSDSPVVVVPDVALSLPAPAQSDQKRVLGSALDEVVGEAAAGAGPAGTRGGVGGGSSLPALGGMGIPIQALEGYRAAARLVNASDPGCHIDWALLAAIGRVESNHARFGGNQLDAAGVARPGIIGLPLNGSSGTALIPDSDGGTLDGDRVYDRAVGPMQFIPSTWRVVGADANGDGVKDPQNMADAATASAIYLCSGPGDLSKPADLFAAIMRYNASTAYVQTVTSIAASYRLGVSALPTPALAALRPAPPKPAAAKAATKATKPASSKAATAKPGTAATTTVPVQPKPTTTVPPVTPTATTVPPVATTTVPPVTTTTVPPVTTTTVPPVTTTTVPPVTTTTVPPVTTTTVPPVTTTTVPPVTTTTVPPVTTTTVPPVTTAAPVTTALAVTTTSTTA